MPNHSIFLKRALLFFWATWFTLVFASNVADGLRELGLLPESWAFSSGNFRFVAETTSRYGTPEWLNAVLFAGAIVWEGLAAFLFWRAFWAYRDWKAGLQRAYLAMIVSLLLWATFLIVDEVFIAYAVEGTHFRLFIATLATVLVMELLPE
jgi:hypothetical protein